MATLVATVDIDGTTYGGINTATQLNWVNQWSGVFDDVERVPETPYGGADGSYTPATVETFQEARLITISFELWRATRATVITDMDTLAALFRNTGLIPLTFLFDAATVKTYNAVGKSVVFNDANLEAGHVSALGTFMCPDPNPV